jgi:MFS family permease
LPDKISPRSRVFTGWWSVLFIGIMSGLGHGFNTYGISVLFKPIAAELELNRALTSLAAGMGRLEGGITAPLVGWLSDKFGPRWIVIIGTFFAAAGMVMMNYISRPWHYYVAWGCFIGLGLNIGLTVACDKMINDWFIRRRGLAQGVKFGIISIFGVVVLQVVTWLIGVRDWRFTCLVWGLIIFAGIPFALIFIKSHRPEYYGMLPDGAAVSPGVRTDSREMLQESASYASSLEETEYTFKQALRTNTYWLLMIGFTVHNFVSGGFNVHVFPFMTDIGITEAAAGAMMGMMVFFAIPSRFFGGLIADRIPKRYIQLMLTGAFLLQVIGITTYLMGRNIASVYVLLVCHGFSSGAVTPVIILVLGRYFGRKSFGSILGTMIAFLAPVGLFSPIFYGWVFDKYQSYDIAFIAALVLAVVATVATFLVRTPSPPAYTTATFREK